MTMDPKLYAALATVPPGTRVGGDPEDEAEHFYECKICRGKVDMRNLAEVFRHEEPDHRVRRLAPREKPTSAD